MSQQVFDDPTDGSCGDPIIKLIMQGRQAVHDVPPEFEIERQKRMYHMLVRSKRYQKLRVKLANHNLPGLEALDALKDMSASISATSSSSSETSAKSQAVRFSSSIAVVGCDDMVVMQPLASLIDNC